MDRFKNIRRIILRGILLMGLLFWNCDRNKSVFSPSGGGPDPNYPTTWLPLPPGQLQQLQQEFDALNGNRIVSILDRYGFVGSEHGYRPYAMVKIGPDEALRIAVQAILKNAKFTNVKDSAALFSSSRDVASVTVDSIRWKIIFGPQMWNGVDIPFMTITVWVYGNEPYQISGHWIDGVYIPPGLKTNKEEAKKAVLGKQIIWYDISGKPVEFIVSEESISDEMALTLFPLEKDDTIEIRIVWKIPILSGTMVGWHVYLDAVTGELVDTIQEFRT